MSIRPGFFLSSSICIDPQHNSLRRFVVAVADRAHRSLQSEAAHVLGEGPRQSRMTDGRAERFLAPACDVWWFAADHKMAVSGCCDVEILGRGPADA